MPSPLLNTDEETGTPAGFRTHPSVTWIRGELSPGSSASALRGEKALDLETELTPGSCLLVGEFLHLSSVHSSDLWSEVGSWWAELLSPALCYLAEGRRKLQEVAGVTPWSSRYRSSLRTLRCWRSHYAVTVWWCLGNYVQPIFKRFSRKIAVSLNLCLNLYKECNQCESSVKRICFSKFLFPKWFGFIFILLFFIWTFWITL